MAELNKKIKTVIQFICMLFFTFCSIGLIATKKGFILDLPIIVQVIIVYVSIESLRRCIKNKVWSIAIIYVELILALIISLINFLLHLLLK